MKFGMTVRTDSPNSTGYQKSENLNIQDMDGDILKVEKLRYYKTVCMTSHGYAY